MNGEEMGNLQDLLSRQADLQRQIAAARKQEREAVLLEIRDLMRKHGISAADVSVSPANQKGPRPGKKVAAKYRDPSTGSSWSGRGLKPKWLTEALAKGRSLAEFCV